MQSVIHPGLHAPDRHVSLTWRKRPQELEEKDSQSQHLTFHNGNFKCNSGFGISTDSTSCGSAKAQCHQKNVEDNSHKSSLCSHFS